MWTYFKPLRRKIAILTISAASTAIALWLKSLYESDYLELRDGKTQTVIVSCDGLFSIDVSPCVRQQFTAWSHFSGDSVRMTNHEGVPVPYVVIVIPLLALSAYLLLSQPSHKPSTPPADACQ